MEELEKVKGELSTALAEVDTLKAALTAKEAALAEIDSELKTLQEFKSNLEAEAEARRQFDAVKEKFASAGILKDDAYFEERKDMLLGMTDTSLDFFIQELVSFKSAEASEQGDKGIPKTPAPKSEFTVKELAEALVELRKQ